VKISADEDGIIAVATRPFSAIFSVPFAELAEGKRFISHRVDAACRTDLSCRSQTKTEAERLRNHNNIKHQSRVPRDAAMKFWSARTCPRFGTTRHVASKKAASSRRSPNKIRRIMKAKQYETLKSEN
jgi:hypothetical protein